MARKYLPNGYPDYENSTAEPYVPKTAEQCDRICRSLDRDKSDPVWIFHDQRRKFLRGQWPTNETTKA